MKSLLIAMGLAVALTVGAQTTTDEQQKQAQQKEKTKAEENAQPSKTKEPAKPAERARTQTNVDKDVNKPQNTRVKSEERIQGDEQHSGARVDERGEVSHSTAVFRNGQETHESLALHRGFRDRSDVHFGIGSHPRDWWLKTYSIVVMDGCHYYLADNGCWYPAYGFDPSCSYPDGVVYCE
jgi:glucose/arabinose dehydrogenase